MSMDLGGAKGGIKSDINVTPLVDVMLVLLIIMMLVAPMLQQGVSVAAPHRAEQRRETVRRDDQTVVAIAANKAIYLKAQPIQNGELVQKINEILESKPRRSSSSRPMRRSSTAR